MAADAVTMVAESPLDASQVSKASSALLKHISSTQQAKAVQTSKKNLLADEDALSDSYTSTTPNNPADTPLWLILTTKHHIADTPRLKPGKIPIPHSLHPPNTTRILLITASPQRTYKDLLAHPAFPAPLAARIARVIDVGKLKAKFKAFEAKRQLDAEHDVVLADERVTPLLPGLLGKVFFRGGAKRPVPVRLTGKEKFEKRPEVGRRRPKEAKKLVGGPRDVADEIEKALAAALVHLAPSTTTAVKVGYAAWSAEMVAANVNALVPALVERFVPRKWSNVKSVHLKGPETAALPIYMADELWVDEAEDVREDGFVEDVGTKKVRASKRLLLESGNENGDAPQSRKEKSAKSSKKDKRKADEAGDELEKEIAAKKAKLKKTKAAAMSKGGVEL